MQEKSISQIILFDNVATDQMVQKADALSHRFLNKQGIMPSPATPADYYEIQKEMLKLVGSEEVTASYWKNYICGLVGSSDNVFSHMAEKGEFDFLELDSTIDNLYKIDSTAQYSILELAIEEIRVIRNVYNFDFTALAKAIESETKIKTGLENIASVEATPAITSRRQRIKEAFDEEDEWDTVKILVKYYRAHGAGFFESFDAFTWNNEFVGVRHPDPITMDDLVGYEIQKNQIIMNTEFLMRNLPCNNMLLYGDSGTGKSSSIKAILNQFKYKGMKLIAVPKDKIEDLPRIYDIIKGRGLKFIIFIDDLSFEENESSYKLFKSIIEGNISSSSGNSIICVTSNRRNIVKEVWSDRETSDDVHLRDNLQEKRSLSDRFGLTIVYSAPSKAEYLEIVESLAEKSGISLDIETLHSKALTWEVRHGGRSGRTAKQFIDHLTGLLELDKQLK